MIAQVIAATGLGSSLLLLAGLGVIVWLLTSDRRAR